MCKCTLVVAGILSAATLVVAQPPTGEPVRAISAPLHPLPPEASSRSISKFSFIAYGDTRGRRDGEAIQYEHSLVVDGILAAIKTMDTTSYPVRFVLQTGDAAFNGGETRQWNISFTPLIDRITREGGVPYYLAPGNHDVTKSNNLQDPERKKRLPIFLSALANLIPPDGSPRRLSGYPTYAFGYGNAFFIAFDSNIADDSTQFNWVKRQLEGLDTNRYRVIVAFCHQPAFSSGYHGGARIEPQTADMRKMYMPLFRKHHVRMLFCGHEHFFEHWVERYEDAAGKKYRMDQVLTGGGGAPLYAFTGKPDVEDYEKTYAPEKVSLEQIASPGTKAGDNPHHFVLVKVDGEKVELEVIGIDWGRDFKPYSSKQTTLNDE